MTVPENDGSPLTTSTPRAAYIHVPFCVHRCGYCDFTLVAKRDDLIGDYLIALEKELAQLDGPYEVDTLFFGGGTPTQLMPDQLERLFEIVRQTFRPAPNAEISVEANPDGFSRTKVGVLADAGVNRLSLGVQSFDSLVLHTLERRHSAADVVRAIGLTRQRIENVGIDLIFAVPGQSIDLWRRTLEYAIEIEPSHISTYGLTWEKGTQFWTRREKGELLATSEEDERTMYGMAMDLLPASGFEQYEISNFARPGFACRHNETYWKGHEYFAAGPGAARYVGGTRETNHRSVFTWLKKSETNECLVGETEGLDRQTRAHELIMLGLRRTVGIDLDQFTKQTGFMIQDLCGDAIARHTASGLLEESAGHLRLTREGRFVADSVVVDML